MNYKDSIDYIFTKTKLRPEVGYILGSGLGEFGDHIQEKTVISYSEIPHFKKPKVEGHSGEMVIGKLSGKTVVAMKGRVHFYEGHTTDEVVYPVRVLGKMGVKTLVVTNSSGGLKKTMKAGEFMVITDHINLTGQNPLIGTNDPELGVRFPDMTTAYNKDLTKKLLATLKKLKIRHSKGVYCGVTGPTYETPAEIRYMNKIGGGAVGMSTVMEVIAAHHMGMSVCGLALITNLGAGILNKPLHHKEVTEAAQKAQKNFIKILTDFTKSV